MECLKCSKLLKRVISYKNIFAKDIHKICEFCFDSINFIHDLIVIPVEGYILNLNVLLKDYQNSLAYMSFLKPYYIYYIKNIKESIILYFNDINDKIYKILNIIRLGNIYAIALKTN